MSGKVVTFRYHANTAEINPNSTLDHVYHIMQDMSLRMEAISQRFVSDTVGERGFTLGGLSTSDVTSNSLGINGMLELLIEKNILAHIRSVMQQQNNLHTRPGWQTSDYIYSLPERYNNLQREVIRRITEKFGVRATPSHFPSPRPGCFHPYIPSMLEGGIPPAMEPAQGINVDRSSVEFSAEKIPVISMTALKALEYFT
jgi:hypothetical protein